jgi:hypothetical protein
VTRDFWVFLMEDHDDPVADLFGTEEEALRHGIDALGSDAADETERPWLTATDLDVLHLREAFDDAREVIGCPVYVVRAEIVASRKVGDEEWTAICTCGSWTDPSSGPSNVAHEPLCSLMRERS